MRPGRRVLGAVAALACWAAAAGAGAPVASASTTWLCRPGLAGEPCAGDVSTTEISVTGTPLRRLHPVAVRPRPIDCFYVYPTVSDQPTPTATLRVDPEERSIARFQVARYGSVCRIFAPMYHQVTLQGLLHPETVTAAMRDAGYRDVRDAWRDYLAHDNHGRGVVLIGHSQGTFVLRRLIAHEIDGRARARRRLVSAILLGGNVLVGRGRDTGGDFRHLAACRSASQLHCVIAFSTFDQTPPPNALFGRPGARFGDRVPPGSEVLCTNPAALGGGSAPLQTILPAAPFAAGTTIGALTTQIGFPPVTATTTWAQADGVYSGTCSSAAGAHVLRITGAVAGAPTLRPLADATWGLHLTDANIALGDLVRVVTGQARRLAAAGGHREAG